MKQEIFKKLHDRFVILSLVYKEANGRRNESVDIADLADKKNIRNGVLQDIIDYLVGEDLITHSKQPIRTYITHKGIKAIEFAYLNPDEDGEFFPSLISLGVLV